MANCSTTESRFDKKQMYEDFDEFISIIEQVNPQLDVRYKVTGYNQLDSIKKMRDKIESLNDIYEYIRLLKKASYMLHDIHANMLYAPTNLAGHEYCDTSFVQIMQKYRERYENRDSLIMDFFTKNLPTNAIYTNGDYYIPGTLCLLDNISGDTLHTISNAKILKYNGKSYQEFINENLSTIEYPRWDFDNRKFYTQNFYIKRDSYLTLENYDHEVIELDLRKFPLDCVKFASISIESLKSNKEKREREKIDRDRKEALRVEYFDDLEILYIYLRQMQVNDTEELLSKIKGQSENRKINKIIIDVRNNAGGNDDVWHNILKYAVKDTLTIKGKLAVNNTNLVKKYLSANEKSKYKENKIALLGDKSCQALEEKFALVPDMEGLKYDGKIYILQDENTYSSAHALAAFARQHEQLVSVGRRSGLLAGLGVAPWVFQLKHSKFTFTLEPVLDVTGVTDYEGFYHDKPEVLVSLTKDEFFKMKDAVYFYDIHSEEYLVNHDPVFKKVLELE
jgi:hypothetical protein